MSALPSVYNTNTKSGKRPRPKPSAKPRHQHPPTKVEPSPYSTTTLNNKSQHSEPPPQPDDEYPKVVPKTRLDQLLSTLGNALQLGSTLNRGNWVIPTASNKNTNQFEMNDVVPHFANNVTYAPGVYGNIVARELTDTEPRPPVPPSTDYLYQAAIDLPQEGGPSLEKEIEKDFKQRLKQLKARHTIYTARMKDRMDHVKSIGTHFDETTTSCISRSTLAHLLYERKCRVQSSVANRRLQELLFECLGEIEKACLRSTLLAETLCENVVAQKTQIEKSTVWKEFLMRAEEDAQQQLNLAALDRKEYTDYFNTVSDECREALISSRYVPEEAIISVQRIVAVRPGRHLPQTRRRGRDTRRRVSRLHHNNEEVAILLAALNKEYAKLSADGSGSKKKKDSSKGDDDEEKQEHQDDDNKSKSKRLKLRHSNAQGRSSGKSSGSNGGGGGDGSSNDGPGLRLPLFPAVVQMSSSVIKWLLPPSGCSVNSAIYYCLEARTEQWSSHRSGSRSNSTSNGSSSASPTATHTKSTEGTVSGATYARVQHAVCKVLADLYTGSSGGNSSSAEGPVLPMTVFETCNEHRNSLGSNSRGVLQQCALMSDEQRLVEQFLISYPDVVRVRDVDSGRVLHFAPASVLQIFETQICHTVCQALSKEGKSKVHAHYPPDAVMRTADLKLYHLDKETGKKNKTRNHGQSGGDRTVSPLIGSQMVVLGQVPMRELCSMYGVAGEVDNENNGGRGGPGLGSGAKALPNSMSIFNSDAKVLRNNGEEPEGRGEQEEQGDRENRENREGGTDHSKLSYFVLHNPTTKAVQLFLDKRLARSKKARLARKQDCYGGLVEKERVAAVEYGRNKPIPGSSSSHRNRSKKDKDEDEAATGSTVPSLALLVGVHLPHRHESTNRMNQLSDNNQEKDEHGSSNTNNTENEEAKKVESVSNLKRRKSSSAVPSSSSSSSEPSTGSSIISGLAVGSFCRWRGCLCKGTKIPVLSSGKQSKHALCGLHSILRSFLEGKTTTNVVGGGWGRVGMMAVFGRVWPSSPILTTSLSPSFHITLPPLSSC